jgi:uncharacterized protein
MRFQFIRISAMAFLVSAMPVCTIVFADTDTKGGQTAQELQWDDLIPKDFNPNEVYRQYQQKYNIDELADDDPRVKELQEKLSDMFKNSPVNNALNGKMIKLPGYVVPLETNGTQSSEFLLVPYYGACIHVPPPPANQTVYVSTQDKKGAAIRKLFDVVWVTGVMKTEKLSTDLADTGYTISATKVEPY